MSIHDPRINWHEPKHFMKEYSSATIVEGTVFFNFFDFHSQLDIHTTFLLFSCDSAENTVMTLCEDPSSLFRYEESGNPIILNGPVIGQNWSFSGCDLSCLASLLSAFTSPMVCSTLQPIYQSQKVSVPCTHCRSTVEIFFRVSLWRACSYIRVVFTVSEVKKRALAWDACSGLRSIVKWPATTSRGTLAFYKFRNSIVFCATSIALPNCFITSMLINKGTSSSRRLLTHALKRYHFQFDHLFVESHCHLMLLSVKKTSLKKM